ALGGSKNAPIQLFDRDGHDPRFFKVYESGGAQARIGPHGDVLMAYQKGDVRFLSIPDGRELRRGLVERGGAELRTVEDGFLSLTNVDRRWVLRFWPERDGDSRVLGSLDGDGFDNFSVVHGVLAYSQNRRIYVRSLEHWATPPRLVAEAPANVASARL